MSAGEIKELRDLGDRILVVNPIHGRGRTSGIKLDACGAVRYTFRDGRILRVDAALDPDRDRALDAVGAVEAAELRV